MGPLIWTLLAVAALALAVYFLFCALLVRKFLARKPDHTKQSLDRLCQGPYGEMVRQERDWYPARPWEDVFTESYDGLRLHGRYLAQKDPRGTLLLVHGFHSSGWADFSCVLRSYFELGFDLLVIDQRAHLQSGGQYLTMGIRERYDVRTWCLWLLERFGEGRRVVLDGLSMGATTVLLAAGLDLPKNVCGVIADCGFTSPRDIFLAVMKDRYHIPTCFLWGAGLCCRVMAGFSMDEASTVDALRHCTLPLLLVHGEADDFVPCSMTRAVYEAAGCEKTLLTVPGAGHGMSFLVEHDRLYAALVDFLDKHCPRD